MRVAVIGAGVSGLVAGYLLSETHDVEVFEANNYAGGHTRTVHVETAVESYDVDTGFIVFNDRNYPRFTRLLGELGVESRLASMSFSVSNPDGSFELSSSSTNGVFAVRRHLCDPTFHRLLVDVVRCQRAVRRLTTTSGRDARDPANAAGLGDLSLGEWLAGESFSERFLDRVLVPMMSSVWSADPKHLWTFPMSFIAEFFGNHGMLRLRDRPKWFTIVGGSARYVEQLLGRWRGRLHLSTPVERVERRDGGVLVSAAGRPPELFDQVVLATHSDQALRLLVDASDRERDALAGIPYQDNDVVLHTDRRLLPRRRRAWASWNYHLLDPQPDRVVMTYDMTRLQGLRTDTRYCVTLNRTHEIDPSKVIGRYTYAHPVYGPGALRAQASRPGVSGTDRIHLCGAYWGWGFHEDGVESAVRVARRLGGRAL